MSDFRSRSNEVRGAWCAVLGALFLCTAASLPSQAPKPSVPPAIRLRDSAIALIAKALPAGDLQGLRSARALLERSLVVTPGDAWLQHYLGYALYREATLVMGRDGADAGPILERADELLEASARSGTIPESHALRSGALGMMIGSNPIKGMTLGPKSGDEMEKALAMDPTNPRVWLLRGIGAINTPEMFGGGLDKAEDFLKRSISFFAKDKPQPPAPSWGAHEAHTWLGQVYAKQGKVAEARAEYEKALAIEPNDMWVRMSLLPALDKKK
jgi:tetratricopeptide (TPR) repeat protein